MSFMVDVPDLERAYFGWLYDKVVRVNSPDSPLSYWYVCGRMFEIEFQALIPNDENRIADATEFVSEFLRTHDGDLGQRNDLLLRRVSVFEMLVAFAYRVNDVVPMDPEKWFQLFLKNLGLELYSDAYCLEHSTGKIPRILSKFNDRRYSARGEGGLFPLDHPLKDQRQVELWYQFGAYTEEKTMY